MYSLFSVSMRLEIGETLKLYMWVKKKKNPSLRKGYTKMQGERSSKGGVLQGKYQRQPKTYDHTKICT